MAQDEIQVAEHPVLGRFLGGGRAKSPSRCTQRLFGQEQGRGSAEFGAVVSTNTRDDS